MYSDGVTSLPCRSIVLALALALAAACAGVRASSPPRDVVTELALSPFYAKYVDADGLPVVASSKVSDYALLEARFLIDPYASENILVHEFAHTVHEIGMRHVDPTFDRRLAAAYENAMRRGLWKNTYASRKREEYWAEGAQSWFDCNRTNDDEHGPIDTREELEAYHPDLAALLAEVFGDRPWRYTKPSRRPPGERAHHSGFDPRRAVRRPRRPSSS